MTVPIETPFCVFQVPEKPDGKLAAQVAKELGEQTEASRKLRLLRLCKNLCTPEARWQAAVLVTALRPLHCRHHHPPTPNHFERASAPLGHGSPQIWLSRASPP